MERTSKHKTVHQVCVEINMWDSAKKPIKVRSVLQPNGMRHFIVNEEAEEVHTTGKSMSQQSRNSNKTMGHAPSNEKTSPIGQHQPFKEKYGHSGSENNGGIFSENKSKKEQVRRNSIGSSCAILHCPNTLNDWDDRWVLSGECDGNFFGVSGSKIYNSKKYKGYHQNPRYFQQFPHGTKSNVEVTKYPHLRADVLDLVPVKSPVIKKLINGRASNSTYSHNHEDSNDSTKNQRFGTNQRNNGAPSTTLCSRIMTWIDLEVKRNAGKSKISTSGSLSYNSADLSIVNELMLPGSDYDHCNKSNALSSSPASDSSSSGSSSSASSSSGDSANATSCSSSSCSSSSVSLPKLIPCWRKEGSNSGLLAGTKAKKSVRIAEDLPRWGKMKRRLRRKTLSLNELYDDEPFSAYYDRSSNKKTDYSSGIKPHSGKKGYSSVMNLLEENNSSSSSRNNLRTSVGGPTLDHDDDDDTAEQKETDSFVVCDERLLTSGKLQVHIFLPQTESSSNRGGSENACSLSGRSEDST